MEQKQPLYDIVACGSNISYILRDNSSFASTEYKILKSRSDGILIDCYKMYWNGRIQLLYITDRFITMDQFIQNNTIEENLVIINQFLSAIISVKNNGFLSHYNIDISFNHVFIDSTNSRVHLVYLPMNQKFISSPLFFKNFLYTELNKVATYCPPIKKLLEFCSNNDSLSIEDIYAFLVYNNSALLEFNERQVNQPKIMKMVALDTPIPFELTIDKDDYIIGRNESVVDGYIPFSRMIGRKHCKIKYINYEFYVVDLNSANGTYLNQNKDRLPSNQLIKLQNGDVIRLAKSKFGVEIL